MFRAVRAWIDHNYKIKFQKTIYIYLIAGITMFICTLKDRIIQFADAALLSVKTFKQLDRKVRLSKLHSIPKIK